MMANWDCAVHVCSAFPSLMLPDCIVEVEGFELVSSETSFVKKGSRGFGLLAVSSQ